MGVPTGGVAAALAIIVSITSADLDRAISIGRSSDAERARFHAPYIVRLNDATVEQFEVVTELRRAVLIVEERARLGDRIFGLGQLETALRPFHNQVTIRATLRFHPMNALPGIPAYELRVGTPEDRLLALGPTVRSPIYVQGGRDKAQSLMGATLELTFDSGIIGQSRQPVTVVLEGKPVASTAIDFARLD